MADPIVSSARAAVSGIREALEVGKEIEALGSDIAKLGDADIAARAAYRKKNRRVSGNTVTFEAVEEWRRVKDVEEIVAELQRDIVAKYGKSEWDKIRKIRERMAKEQKDEVDEYGHDLRKMRALKWWCFGASAFCTYWLWYFNLI
jgi:hypothetical protein